MTLTILAWIYIFLAEQLGDRLAYLCPIHVACNSVSILGSTAGQLCPSPGHLIHEWCHLYTDDL